MRFLVLGAGAVGGYLGGRMAQAGADVTFLVRPARYDRLKAGGLVIKSSKGDATLQVQAVRAGEVKPEFDLVVLACKAYDLEDAMASVAPAIGAGTAIVPLLNGMRHHDTLDGRFGAEKVLGGIARISAVLGPAGEIVHLSPFGALIAGERTPGTAPRPSLAALGKAVAAGGLEGGVVDDIGRQLWDKWIMLCTLASMCCAMRGNTGQILATDEGEALMRETAMECYRVGVAEGQDIGEKGLQNVLGYLTVKGSKFAASMLGDLERGGKVEAEHVVGDMLARARAAGIAAPNLRFAYAHLQAYQVRNGLKPAA